MKVFEMEEFNHDAIESFFRKRIRRKGILSKQDLESVTISPAVWRPFRFIKFTASRISGEEQESFRSIVDESLAPLAIVSNDWFLLWRPLYLDNKIQNSEESIVHPSSDTEPSGLQDYVDAFVIKIQESQKTLLEMDEELRGIQLGSGAAFPMFVPRSPKSRHRENDLAQERKSIHGFSVAASLVTNCPLDYRIDSVEIVEQVYIQTIMASFQDIESRKDRLLFLENIGEGSLDKALQNGIALTRMCEKDDIFKKKLKQSFS